MIIYHLRIITVLSACLFFFSTNANAQSLQSAKDSTFIAYMKSASKDLNKNNFADSLQNKYADDFYDYYKQNPHSELGSRALTAAFTMWGNTGAGEQYDNAIGKLSYNSKNWQLAISPGHNVYYLDEDKSIDKYIKFVEKLRQKLTHPLSKSQALLYLARHYNKEGQTKKSVKLAREIIDINASEWFVEQALGFQYEAEKLGVGSIAPNFIAKTIQGDEISLSDLKGKIIILEFWATWCGPCIPEIPHLKAIDNKYLENEVQIIGISLDSDLKKLNEFITDQEMRWPQVQQAEKYDDDISKLYNVYVIPRSFIVDRTGMIVAKNKKGDELQNEIENLIQQ